MLGKTHKRSQSIVFIATLCFGCYNVKDFASNNNILELYLIILLLASKSTNLGIVFPDYDQSVFGLCPSRDYISKLIYRFVHFVGATHRSWHTHSFDLPVIIIFVSTIVFDNSTDLIKILLYTCITGFCLAWIFHLMLDIISEGGIIPSIILLTVWKFILNILKFICGFKKKKYKKNYGVVRLTPSFIKVFKLKDYVNFSSVPILKHIPIVKKIRIKILKLVPIFDGNYKTGSDYEYAVEQSFGLIEPVVIIGGIYLSLKIIGYSGFIDAIFLFLVEKMSLIFDEWKELLNL